MTKCNWSTGKHDKNVAEIEIQTIKSSRNGDKYNKIVIDVETNTIRNKVKDR